MSRNAEPSEALSADEVMLDEDSAGGGTVVDAKPRTLTVVGLVALTSLVLSYLGAYAVTGALVNAEVLHRWHPDADPRPRWLAIAFCVLLAAFFVLGGVARHLSQRQLREIDEMSSEN